MAWCGKASLFRANALVDRIDRKAKSPLVRFEGNAQMNKTTSAALAALPEGCAALPAHVHRQPQPPPLVE